MTEVEWIRDIHCRRCPEDSLPARKDYPYSLGDGDETKQNRNFQMAEGCRLLQLYSDRIIDVGPDSFVLESDDENTIIKLYPDSSEREILFYQQETGKAAQYLDGTEILVPEGKFSLYICKIFDVTNLTRGCVIATQNFIPGLNEEKRMFERYRATNDDSEILLLKEVNRVVKEYFRSIATIEEGRTFDPSDFYVMSLNMKVDEIAKKIYITDLACKVNTWNKRVALITGQDASSFDREY